jgi:hypothetical protein
MAGGALGGVGGVARWGVAVHARFGGGDPHRSMRSATTAPFSRRERIRRLFFMKVGVYASHCRNFDDSALKSMAVRDGDGIWW